MIGYTNSTASKPLSNEIVNIRLSSNQNNNLIGTTFTLNYGGQNKDYTWEGSDITISIPEHTYYTITFNSVEGYKTPNPISYTAEADNVRNIEAIYYAELVIVNVKDNNGNDITNANIVIDGTIYTGKTITHKVPYGKQYTITPQALTGYNQPSAMTFTAGQTTREISVIYNTYTLTVNILSNQSNDNTISSVKAKVTYGSTTIQASNGVAVNIPLNSKVTITFPEVTGYKAPDPITYTHTATTTKSGTYYTELLTVNISSTNGQMSTYSATISQKDFIKSTLPNGYTAIEYIEATGSQYLNTGVVPSDDLVTEIGYKPTQGYTNEVPIFGADWWTNGYFLMCYQNLWRFHTRDYVYDSSFTIDTTKFTSIRTTTSSISIQGTKIAWAKGSTEDAQINILLFYTSGINMAPPSYGYGRLSYCKMWKGTTLVRDFIPAINNNGVVGLYDKVNKVFYSSSSNTSFIAGPEVAYSILEYVEGDGSQYIDTNYFATSEKYRVNCKFSFDSIVSNTVLFGGGSSTDIISVLVQSPLKIYVGGGSVLSITASTGNIHTLDCTANSNSFSAIFNGTTYTSSYSNSINKEHSLAILGNNITGNVSMMTKAKIYSFQIYDNNILVRDFIPVLRSDNVPGLYDKVNELFFSSKNSLIAGPEVGGDIIATQNIATQSHKIPFETSYEVAGGNIDGFITPNKIYNIANQKSRTINLQYGTIPWELVYQPSDINVQDIVNIDGTLYIADYVNNYIYTSTDARNFTANNSYVPKPRGILKSNRDGAFVIWSDSAMYRFSTFPGTGTKISTFGTEICTVICAGNDLLYCGYNTNSGIIKIFKSNGVTNWTEVYSLNIGTGSLSSCSLCVNGDFIVGEIGETYGIHNVIKSTNCGTTWETLSSNTYGYEKSMPLYEYANGLYIKNWYNYNNSTQYYEVSYDGLNWSLKELPIFDNKGIDKILYKKGNYYIATTYGIYMGPNIDNLISISGPLNIYYHLTNTSPEFLNNTLICSRLNHDDGADGLYILEI